MTQCPACSTPVLASNRFCSSCGAALDGSSDALATLVKGREGPRSQGTTVGPDRSRLTAMGRLHLSDSLHQARFLPGMLLLDRYRIVGLLGKGGMGEVYRADDLRLGQAVALKFLPDLMRSSPGRLEMFYEEVRLARQVSHPHVCRVYDVGEIEGAPFLTMEYIDGEDLASLLRRIGRLPQERAVQVARQICSGLAAIHDRGILHRDLKPANVMLDGRGAARITDFGLAALAGDVASETLRSGTPAYMAPEQLAGEEPTPRSDVYALGLVLYEIFTGRSAFDAESVEELTRQRRETRPDPSSHVQNLDPIVERVLLRCLENDPRDRPGSALSVAAALPGGDPLAAALAAGETPSPEMVAAAGEPGALRPIAAGLSLAAVILGMVIIALLAPTSTLLGLTPVRKSPAALEERAHQVIEALQVTTPAADHAHSLGYDADYLRWIETTDHGPGRWQALSRDRPPAIFYYYRQSPRPLEAVSPSHIVRLGDPPLVVSGMVTVVLDTEGRLVELHAVPAQVEPKDASSAPAPAPDPGRMFQLAGLDLGAFRPVSSSWTPPLYADMRLAWEGPHPGLREGTVRVESAFYRGQPVYFEIVGPWSRPARAQSFEQTRGLRVAQALNILVVVSVLVGAMLLARRNVRLGRGDRRGAFRVGVAVFLMTLATWELQAHHATSVAAEWSLLVWGVSIGLFQSGLLWLLYLALEPFIRRRWPDSIISWSRLLAGWWRDPRIGRDIVVGGAFGLAIAVVDRLRFPVSAALGLAPGVPAQQPLELLMGGRFLLVEILGVVISALVQGMFFLFFLFLGRWRSERNIVGGFIFIAIATMFSFLYAGTGPVAVHLAAALLTSILLLSVLSRFGLLASIACMFFSLWNTPIMLTFTDWYGPVGMLAALIPLALAVFGFVTSLGLRPAGLRPALAD